ncbi:GlyGly-CTERM sorting domain-containing protein [Aeromonas sp. R1-1]|uniref:GlyGly-CTERM sorting domain-containing protein n=1 Tax=Aeromonas sp. R1-1 TaxID=3138455 RepID=UPI0034A5D134
MSNNHILIHMAGTKAVHRIAGRRYRRSDCAEPVLCELVIVDLLAIEQATKASHHTVSDLVHLLIDILLKSALLSEGQCPQCRGGALHGWLLLYLFICALCRRHRSIKRSWTGQPRAGARSKEQQHHSASGFSWANLRPLLFAHLEHGPRMADEQQDTMSSRQQGQ